MSFDPDAPQESTVKLEIKTDTLNTGVAQLNKEIKGPAFLDVEKFPLITFKNTSAQRINDQQYTLTGDLTFHGVTNPLTLRSNRVGQSKDSKGESHDRFRYLSRHQAERVRHKGQLASGRRRHFLDYTRPQLIFPRPLIEIDLIAPLERLRVTFAQHRNRTLPELPPAKQHAYGVYLGNSPLKT